MTGTWEPTQQFGGKADIMATAKAYGGGGGLRADWRTGLSAPLIPDHVWAHVTCSEESLQCGVSVLRLASQIICVVTIFEILGV